jgi:hypothetical protein
MTKQDIVAMVKHRNADGWVLIQLWSGRAVDLENIEERDDYLLEWTGPTTFHITDHHQHRLYTQISNHIMARETVAFRFVSEDLRRMDIYGPEGYDEEAEERALEELRSRDDYYEDDEYEPESPWYSRVLTEASYRGAQLYACDHGGTSDGVENGICVLILADDFKLWELAVSLVGVTMKESALGVQEGSYGLDRLVAYGRQLYWIPRTQSDNEHGMGQFISSIAEAELNRLINKIENVKKTNRYYPR